MQRLDGLKREIMASGGTMADTGAALGWIGHRVDDVYGGRLGKIEDVYVDGRTQTPIWMLARIGRFGDEHVVIPVADAVGAAGAVWIPHERQTVTSAARISPGTPITREIDLALASHYGIAGRREETVGDLPVGAISCVPVLAGDGELHLTP
jgi:hypothetical protein